MIRLAPILFLLTALGSPMASASPQSGSGLRIVFVDVEGGAATLIVTPAGEAVLIDTGNPGARDAGRIHNAAQELGLSKIDHVVCTHWHLDHYGGHGDLARLMPLGAFYDRGIPRQTLDDPDNFPRLIAAYREASGGKSVALKPGDEVPLKQTGDGPAVRLKCLVGSGSTVADDLSAPPNPVALKNRPADHDPSDNAMSLGFVLEFGEWRFLDLGDLTWNMEYKLVAPTDKIGKIDVYQTTHHGLNASNNPVLIETVSPRVAIFNNGSRKGGHPDVTRALRALPELKAIFQVHRNVGVGPELNTDPARIANMDADCKGETIRLTVAPDARSYMVQVGALGRAERFETRRSK